MYLTRGLDPHWYAIYRFKRISCVLHVNGSMGMLWNEFPSFVLRWTPKETNFRKIFVTCACYEFPVFMICEIKWVFRPIPVQWHTIKNSSLILIQIFLSISHTISKKPRQIRNKYVQHSHWMWKHTEPKHCGIYSYLFRYFQKLLAACIHIDFHN